MTKKYYIITPAIKFNKLSNNLKKKKGEVGKKFQKILNLILEQPKNS